MEVDAKNFLSYTHTHTPHMCMHAHTHIPTHKHTHTYYITCDLKHMPVDKTLEIIS